MKLLCIVVMESHNVSSLKFMILCNCTKDLRLITEARNKCVNLT